MMNAISAIAGQYFGYTAVASCVVAILALRIFRQRAASDSQKSESSLGRRNVLIQNNTADSTRLANCFNSSQDFKAVEIARLSEELKLTQERVRKMTEELSNVKDTLRQTNEELKLLKLMIKPTIEQVRSKTVPIIQLSSVPAIAFGAALWRKYIGDVGIEPPLPPNIAQIFASKCPFWPKKTVGETHLLVLIPEAVNGLPLTLKLLRQLVLRPLGGGHHIKFKEFNLGECQDPYAPKATWVLLTRNVIDGSRCKTYIEQKNLIASYKLANITYQIPSILDATVCIIMEYFRTGVRLYSDSPKTITRCQELYKSEGWVVAWQMTIGDFSNEGISLFCQSGVSEDYGGVAGLIRL